MHFSPEILKLLPGQRVAAAEWAGSIEGKITGYGLKSCPVCPTLFAIQKLAAAVHVDDLHLVGREELGEGLLTELKKTLKLKVAGPIRTGDEFMFLKRRFQIFDFGVVISANDKYLSKLKELTASLKV